MSANQIVIHTDGSCLNNPGRGGWAAVIEEGGMRREISGGARLSTNNRMELKAAIEALKAVAPGRDSKIVIYTDSQLMVKGIELGWARKWRANNWKRNKSDKAENPDLWAQLLEEIEKREVKFIWTKAHVGTVENERCDELAKYAADNATAVDVVYERSRGNGANSIEQQGIFQPPTSELSAAPKNPQSTIAQKASSATSSATSATPVDYQVEFVAETQSLVIQHPLKGRLEIATSDVASLLEKMKFAIQRGHGF